MKKGIETKPIQLHVNHALSGWRIQLYFSNFPSALFSDWCPSFPSLIGSQAWVMQLTLGYHFLSAALGWLLSTCHMISFNSFKLSSICLYLMRVQTGSWTPWSFFGLKYPPSIPSHPQDVSVIGIGWSSEND